MKQTKPNTAYQKQKMQEMLQKQMNDWQQHMYEKDKDSRDYFEDMRKSESSSNEALSGLAGLNEDFAFKSMQKTNNYGFKEKEHSVHTNKKKDVIQETATKKDSTQAHDAH